LFETEPATELATMPVAIVALYPTSAFRSGDGGDWGTAVHLPTGIASTAAR
jgi:hypothetical protein